MRYLIALLAMIPLAASAQVRPAPATMQVICMPTEQFRNVVGGQHQESPVALGVTGSGRLFELWSSKDGSSWTAAISDGPSAMTCVYADGEALELKPRGAM